MGRVQRHSDNDAAVATATTVLLLVLLLALLVVVVVVVVVSGVEHYPYTGGPVPHPSHHEVRDVLQSIGGVPRQVLQGIAGHGWLYDEVQIVALPERDVVEEDRVKLQTVLKMLKTQ